MHADLDLLCISVYCTADDLLPGRPRNARRRADRRGDRDALCCAGADGDPERPPLPAGGAPPARPPASRGCQARTRCTSGGRRLAETIEWLIGVFAAQSPGCERRPAAARLDPGRVRPLARDRPPLAAGRRLRLRLLAQPLPLVLGDAAAPRLRARRHPARRRTRRRRPARTRGRAARCCRARSAAARRSSATRATPAASSPPQSPRSAPPIAPPSPPRRAADRATPRPDPTTDRVGLLDLQRPAHPRTPRRPHPTQPLRPHRHPAARPRRLHQPQPPTRPTQPRNRRLHRLTPWHQPSSRDR